MKNEASFCDLFCRATQCSPEDFDNRVFWLCIYPHAVLPARLIGRVNRDYFKQDLELIERIKHLSKSKEVELELERFRYSRGSQGFLRGVLKMRISGRRLMDLAGRLFAEAA